MIKKLLLIEDTLGDRWEAVRDAAKELKLDYWPKTRNFGKELSNIEEWIEKYLLDPECLIFLDAKLGDPSEDDLEKESIEKLISDIKTQYIDSGKIEISNFNFENDISKITDWDLQLSLLISYMIKGVHKNFYNLVLVTAHNRTDIIFEHKDLEHQILEKIGKKGPIFDKHDIIRIIQKAFSETALEIFWKETETLPLKKKYKPSKTSKKFDVHQQKDNAKQLLRNFLRIDNDQPWIALKYDCGDDDIIECLKTMCGETSYYNKGDSRLSIMGAFLFLLGAIAWKKKSKHTVTDKIEIKGDIKTLRKKAFINHQSKDIAIKSTRILFDIFSNIVLFDPKHGKYREGELIIDKIELCQEEITITLTIEGTQLIKKSRIAVHSIYYEKEELSFPDNLTQPGYLSQKIAEYRLLNIGKDNDSQDSPALEIEADNDGQTRTILRFKRC